MPFVINPSRGGRRLALACTAMALLVAPAAQAAAPAPDSTARCFGQSFTQTFRPWNDRGSYTLLPGAGMEGDLAGWALRERRADIIEEDELRGSGPEVRPPSRVERDSGERQVDVPAWPAGARKRPRAARRPVSG